eukprot:m.6880 g.6880  ORF g.6880 m.6880 type:complete len:371 (-) comp3599_c0_seq2:191-1303(-)
MIYYSHEMVIAIFVCLFTTTNSTLLDMNLFVAGMNNYSCFRLPNIVTLSKPGHILAIAQGHIFDCSDFGAMDVVIRKSFDGGQTWSAIELVYSETNATKNVSIGNPAAVVDYMHNVDTVFLFITRDSKDLLLLKSTDAGETWNAPIDLTRQLVPNDWVGIYPGLPQGIQMKGGRLVLCANHITNTSQGHSHTIFSDDYGEKWENGKSVAPNHMGECSLAETKAGLWMYARVWWDDPSDNKTHALAFSQSSGTTFEEGNTSAFTGSNDNICDCQGAMVATSKAFIIGAPYSHQHFPRVNYTILINNMDSAGRPSHTPWAELPGADPLWSGPSAYSSLALSRDNSNTLMVLYERGVHSSNEVLRFTKLQLPS